ncbi:MAG: hypothetical protein QOD81_323, partial [Solirubrobacteraceae bacterium]|nr:hypothetical protein [Solirubrobacteraceae bacterium]
MNTSPKPTVGALAGVPPSWAAVPTFSTVAAVW